MVHIKVVKSVIIQHKMIKHYFKTIKKFILCALTIWYILDRHENNEGIFAIAGSEDKDANIATTLLITPGFKGKDHPRECLRFWYTIRVRQLEIFLHHIQM